MKKKKKLKIKNIAILAIIIIILVLILMKVIMKKQFQVELYQDTYYIGEEYKDFFKATYKGKEVTKDVEVKHNIYNKEIGNYQLEFIYNTNNKEYKIVKEISVEDNKEPVIELKSGEVLMVILNSTYKEPGYSAIDSYDGNLTDKVKVTGSVDTSKEGTYTLKYTVKDSSGNVGITKRKVTVTKNSPLTMSVKDFNLDNFFTDVQLKETKVVSDEYVNETIFAGDSTALYYVMNKVITGKQLWHKEGVSLETIFTQNIYVNHIDSKKTLINVVKEKQPKRILLSLGTNSVATMEIDYFIQKYEELLNNLKEVSPNTDIIVQSIFPVAKSLDDANKALNNDKINKMNYKLLELCSKLQIPFLNTAEVLKDENGTLKNGYYRSSNKEVGVHLSETGNKVAMEYFKNHAYEN